MAKHYIRLKDIPAQNLAEGLILRIHYDNMTAEGMNPDGSLKVELVPKDKIREIAHRLIDAAIAESYLQKENGGEDTHSS